MRLDGCLPPHYVDLMQRWLTFLLLSLFAIILTGCGIKGGLKTPPPLWGDDVAQVEEGQEETEEEAEDEMEDLSYGVDVAKNP